MATSTTAPAAPGTPERAPYGRRNVDLLGGLAPQEAPPTYYGLPAVKKSGWGWLIVSYFFVGGMAGAAQVIATVVDLLGHERDRPLVSAGRYLALLGALLSPVFLIADLHTPSRWYNMLRIFRGTSAMSIGSWTLAAFGTFSGLAAFLQAVEDLFGMPAFRGLARLAGMPAGLAGMVMATYTGILLSATATPLWSTVYRLLPALFGVSGTATATAALSLLLGHRPRTALSQSRLEKVALTASAAELALTLAADRRWRRAGVSAPLESPPIGPAYRFGVMGAGIAVPLAVHLLQALTGRELRTLSTLASLSALAGGYTQRAVMVFGGRRSADRPDDYFRVTHTGQDGGTPR